MKGWGGAKGDKADIKARAVELEGMKVGELRENAKALGVDPLAIEMTIDTADDIKATIIQMILAATQSARLPPDRSRPG